MAVLFFLTLHIACVIQKPVKAVADIVTILYSLSLTSPSLKPSLLYLSVSFCLSTCCSLYIAHLYTSTNDDPIHDGLQKIKQKLLKMPETHFSGRPS